MNLSLFCVIADKVEVLGYLFELRQFQPTQKSGELDGRHIQQQNDLAVEIGFEGAVLKQLTETVLTRENITKLMGILQQELKDINRAEIEELDKTKASIRDIESRMDALYEAIENRQFSLEELRPRMLRHQSTMDKLVTRRGELEKSLAEHQPPEIDEQTIREYVSNIGDLLAEGTIAQKRAFIKGFVKALVVKDGEVRMEYTLPDQPVTLKLAEGDGVLPLEQYGGRYRI